MSSPAIDRTGEVCAVADPPVRGSRRLAKRLKERNQPLTPREQGRNLWEAVNQARRLIELADHKARYALVVMGVVNAAVLIPIRPSESM